MRKEADVYALGMLIYEVRLLIEDFLVERSTVSQVLSGKIPCGQPQGFPWGATTTTFIDTDSRSRLGNTAGMLEQGADSEADSGARHDHVHGLRIAERPSGATSKESIRSFQG